jgi:phosphate-selective porin OprO/OprP
MRKSTLLGAAALGALALISTGAQAQDLTTKWKGAPEFSNDDVKFKVRGRILLDGVWENVDKFGTANDYDARAFRGRQVFLGVEGQLNSMFAYKVEGGWVNGGTPSWDDVVIEFKPNDTTSIMAGNIKVGSLENLTSTRFTSFMDRGPFADVTDASYALGVVAKMNGFNWTAAAGVQGASINNADVTAPASGQTDRNERLAYTARVTYAPVLTDLDTVHVGAWARYRDSGSELFGYSARPNTNFGDKVIDTGNYAKADTTLAVEGAWLHGPFSIQGEYAQIKAEGTDSSLLAVGARRQDATFKTGYVFGSWFVTGEQRSYDATKGEFGRPKVLNPLTAGGTGALELLARYDYADLSDARTQAVAPASNLIAGAGKYTAWTAGVNYFPISYVRLTANYTRAKVDSLVANADLDANVFQTRIQLDF